MRALLLLVVLAALAGGAVWASADAELAERLPGELRGVAEGARDRIPDRVPGDHTQGDGSDDRRRERRAASPLPASDCPEGVADCRSVSGRVLYVESVDPDGDGDLHVVLAGRGGVTGPGITAVDVKPSLRPRRDPRVGDRVSAAGPVQTGSHRQSQVHALDFHLRRR